MQTDRKIEEERGRDAKRRGRENYKPCIPGSGGVEQVAT